MNCPNCGAPEQARVMRCCSCGGAFASQDLLELRQLEFLLQETAAWGVAEAVRSPYAVRLAALRAGFQRRGSAQTEVAAEATPVAAPKPVVAEPEPAVTPLPAPAPRPARPKEKVSFDQWLLSERNIKIALYSGGLLLVLAGLIFIGVNWTRIPGPGKFAITLTVTGLTYLGGYLLFQRPAYRLGGIALLGVASGFLTLNFAVLQIYVLGPRGLRDDVMWLIASPLCLLLYLLTAQWTRSDLFTHISLAAAVSTVTAALAVIAAPWLAFVLAYSLLALAVLVLARVLKNTPLADFAYLSLLIASHGGMPLVIVAAIATWAFAVGGNLWLALLALGVGVLFYGMTDALFKWLAARWAAAVLFPLTLTLALIELDFSDTAAGLTLMVLALVYLGVGYALEQREGRRASGWPLYAMAYALALLVTFWATPETDTLAQVLFGDVVLLAVSAAIHRSYWWVYGAVWLFMLPVYIVISLFVPTDSLDKRGLLMGLLGLNYLAAGYALGRRELRWGGPFLTAAEFLSVLVATLTWGGNPIVASLVLGLVATLYLLAALWLGRSWLLPPALLAVNVAVLRVTVMLFVGLTTRVHALIIFYASLGVVLSLGGLGLRRIGKGQWAWPLHLVGACDLAGTYLAALFVGGWLAVGLSAVLALLLLAFAWWEHPAFASRKIPPILTYLGLGVMFFGHYHVLLATIGHHASDVWPGYTAALCALFVALAWLLRHEPLAEVYATPLRRAGLWLMAVPMAGSAFIFEPMLGAVTFAIAGVTFAADAALRRILSLAYLGLGAFVVVIWAMLMSFDVSEAQAYVIPLGLALLGAGWNKRRHGRGISYRLFTLPGLVVLMGSAFIQSLPQGASVYALLLGLESLVSLGWGVWTHSRSYVRVGGLALIANAVAQLGPGFIGLPRWIQLGMTGSVLLGGGMIALIKREEILAVRRRLTEEWRE